jgi:hypothetical protein
MIDKRVGRKKYNHTMRDYDMDGFSAFFMESTRRHRQSRTGIDHVINQYHYLES